jgi:hypothetical protein
LKQNLIQQKNFIKGPKQKKKGKEKGKRKREWEGGQGPLDYAEFL